MAGRNRASLIPLYHKGKIVYTSVGSSMYESFIRNIYSLTNTEKFIPAGYEHRPDLISNLFFDTPKHWWVVMELNGLSDPFESLKTNDRVILPDG